MEDIKPYRIYAAINRQGVVSLWPCRLPDADGRGNSWHESLIEAAELAKTKWIKVAANQHLGAYQVYEAAGGLPEPEWPENSLAQLLKLAFANGHVVDSEDHPLVRRLTGQS
jgi:hypothetical protein